MAGSKAARGWLWLMHPRASGHFQAAATDIAVVSVVTRICRNMACYQHGCLRAALQSELRQQLGHIVLDGLLCQEHLGCDLTICQPFTDERQDPTFLLGQRAQRVVFGSTFAD